MKSFKEYLAESKPDYEWLSFTVEEYEVHILFDSAKECVLTEAKHKGWPIGGQYSAQLHKAHSTVGQEHIHVYARNNQLFALNRDGSAHDASHKKQIPNKVAQAIRDKFPGFVVPPNNIIEKVPDDVLRTAHSRLLLE